MTKRSRSVAHTVRLDVAAWRRVRACAASENIAPATALRQLVIASLNAKSENSRGPLLEVEASLRRIGLLLDRIGPAIVGLPHLLAFWATRESEDVSQDELLAEIATNAKAVWRDEVAARIGDQTPTDPT